MKLSIVKWIFSAAVALSQESKKLFDLPPLSSQGQREEVEGRNPLSAAGSSQRMERGRKSENRAREVEFVSDVLHYIFTHTCVYLSISLFWVGKKIQCKSSRRKGSRTRFHPQGICKEAAVVKKGPPPPKSWLSLPFFYDPDSMIFSSSLWNERFFSYPFLPGKKKLLASDQKLFRNAFTSLPVGSRKSGEPTRTIPLFKLSHSRRSYFISEIAAQFSNDNNLRDRDETSAWHSSGTSVFIHPRIRAFCVFIFQTIRDILFFSFQDCQSFLLLLFFFPCVVRIYLFMPVVEM